MAGTLQTFAVAGLLPKPAVPIRAMWVGSPPDYIIRVEFDRALETIAPGDMYLPNWKIQMFNQLCQVTGGWGSGTLFYFRFRFISPLVAPDYITYRKLVPELIDIEHGLQVEQFIRYPIT